MLALGFVWKGELFYFFFFSFDVVVSGFGIFFLVFVLFVLYCWGGFVDVVPISF